MEPMKTKLVIQELISFFLLQEISDFHIHVKMEGNQSTITIQGKSCDPTVNCRDISRKLVSRRKPELEDYYQHLMSSKHREDELKLIAHIIDDSEVICQGDEILIRVFLTN